jgi:hypothetical protein
LDRLRLRGALQAIVEIRLFALIAAHFVRVFHAHPAQHGRVSQSSQGGSVVVGH